MITVVTDVVQLQSFLLIHRHQERSACSFIGFFNLFLGYGIF